MLWWLVSFIGGSDELFFYFIGYHRCSFDVMCDGNDGIIRICEHGAQLSDDFSSGFDFVFYELWIVCYYCGWWGEWIGGADCY